MWRALQLVVLCAIPGPSLADPMRSVGGTWSLDTGVAGAVYMLASRGTVGNFVICFEAGNVGRVAVMTGDEKSLLARGSCTVFASSPDHGIVVDFASLAADDTPKPVAVGTFRVVPPPDR